MSDNFCFPAELRQGNKVVLFQSPTGENYVVNYVVSKLDEIVLSMEWITMEKKLVKVELFTANFQPISSQTGIANGNQVCFKFCIDRISRLGEYLTIENDADKRNLMFVINIIPCVEVKDYAILSEDEDVLNVSDDKDHSEDLLLGLAIDMKDLLIHGDLSDSVIKTGNDEIKVHAAILSARSPVFYKHFKDPTHEKEITILNAPHDAVKDMIVFIYSGLIKIEDNLRAREVYELAYEYQLQDLHDLCSLHLSKCTADNVLETLILAEKHNDDNLKKYAVNFIVKNFGKLKFSKKWENFAENNTDLISEIFSSIHSAMERNSLRAFI